MEILGLIIFVAMMVSLFVGFGGMAKARKAWADARFFVARVVRERPTEVAVLTLLLLVCTVYGGTKPEPPDEPDEPDEPIPSSVRVLLIGRRADGSLAPYGAPIVIITNLLEEVSQ
jgi:hypothetical protein